VITFFLAALGAAWIKGISLAIGFATLRQAASPDWANTYNSNQALSGFALRLFSVSDFTKDELTATHPHVLHPKLAFGLGVVLTLIAIVAVMVLFFRRAGIFPRPGQDLRLELVEQLLVLTVILLGVPFSHTHYFCLVVGGYFVLVERLLGSKPHTIDKRLAGVAVASFVLLGLLAPLRLFDPIAHRFAPISFVEIWKLWSLPCVGAVLLACALAMAYSGSANDSRRTA
jgi:hypothetical protein